MVTYCERSDRQVGTSGLRCCWSGATVIRPRGKWIEAARHRHRRGRPCCGPLGGNVTSTWGRRRSGRWRCREVGTSVTSLPVKAPVPVPVTGLVANLEEGASGRAGGRGAPT